MDEAEQLIRAPLGLPGSGRVRYGAAMALFRARRLSAPQLEVYREAAAFDARDPVPILAERGLPPVPVAASPDQLRMLLDLATDYLLQLDHPGAAEVRAGLAAARAESRPVRGHTNPVVDRFLAPALASIARPWRPLADAIAAAAPRLCWTTYDAYPPAEIGAAFASGHAFAPILGEDAPFTAGDFEAGLFLVAPGLLYRDHQHAAPELYAPLTGPHGWRFAPGAPIVTKAAHQPVWNPPFRPHLTKVGPVPFLAFYVWTRAVNAPAQVLQAADWTTLEGLPLG